MNDYGSYSDNPLGYDPSEFDALEDAIWNAFPNAGLDEAVDDYAEDFGPAELLSADSLYSRNGATYDGRVESYRAALRNGEDVGASFAFRFNGRTYVVDGNHRAHARIAEGADKIPVRVLDLGEARS